MLAAGHLLRVLLGLIGKSHELQLFHGDLAAFCLAHAAHFEAEFHVLQGGHVREKRVGLEHHGHLALVDRHAGDVLAADHDAAALDVFEAGERAQRGGLAAAGAAEQHDHFAGLDVQVEVVERVNGGAGVDLDDVAHLDGAAAALDAVFEQGLGGLGHVLAAHAFQSGGGVVFEGVLGGSGRGGGCRNRSRGIGTGMATGENRIAVHQVTYLPLTCALRRRSGRAQRGAPRRRAEPAETWRWR